MSTDDDFFNETLGSSEDEQDFGPITRSEIAQVAVATNDWTTETILSQLRKGNIQLNPSFQRRDAWEPKRKSQFIESLILGLPVPQIVLAEQQNQKGSYIVLDGKQRLLCLRQFTALTNDAPFLPFKLSGLVVRNDLNGCTYEDLSTQPFHRSDLTAFENYGLRTVVLRNWRSEKLLGHVFLRLNMGSKALSPQELRQALHPGLFLDFADVASGRSKTMHDILQRNDPDFRMRDVELIIRYFAFRHRLPHYRGNMKEFLDDSCSLFNRNWAALQASFESQLTELDEMHQFVKRAFGAGYKYGKWIGAKFETRFNRAVFDILILSLTDPTLREAAEKSPSTFVKAFQDICVSDGKFLESIERTTKSIDATSYRLTSWFKAVGGELGLNVTPPQVGSQNP